ncbi:hypothetical protein [Micromonospora sp. HM5-17]|jgi:hypothetical protein|uniref:hypothetical protein n=1 Tax=Micromonospora sp. HM5-17 TaxID=2487710 RepID=UPI000F49592B|nr:hypothetical protein [Micromonospora sp. HM5-17]ROT29345.1 hypothetical protein EF879_20405 [Micromonospora sp. HM5-17]
MTQPQYDGVIRGAGENVGEEDDPLRHVRPMLDRLYADDDAPDSERMELISQILMAGLDAPAPDEWDH